MTVQSDRYRIIQNQASQRLEVVVVGAIFTFLVTKEALSAQNNAKPVLADTQLILGLGAHWTD
jgi:hypothetical protein